MSAFGKTVTGFAAALALCSSASVAAVSSPAPAPVSPYAVIGLYGSQSSAQVLCGSTAAAAASAAAQGAGQGCVLPVVDAAPAVVDAGPVAQPVVTTAGLNPLPLILGLGAIIGLAALLLKDKDDGTLDLLPPPAPVSPA